MLKNDKRGGKVVARAKIATIVVLCAIFVVSILYFYVDWLCDLLGMEFKDFLLCCLYAIISPFVSIYYLIVHFPLFGLLECGLYVILVLLFLYNRRYHIPICRSIFNFLISCLPLYAITIRCFLIGKIADSVEFEIIWSLGVTIFIYSVGIIGLIGRKETFYFIVPKRNFVLYLRRFGNEISSDIEDEIATKFGPDAVLRIGDPTTQDGGNITFKGLTFFLPTKNWKPVVRYYMTRAKLIVCKIDTSEGLVWEMFEHATLRCKTVYCINRETDLASCLELYNRKGYNNDVLYYCLDKLGELIQERPLYTNISDCRCVYSQELSEVVDNADGIKYFAIPNQLKQSYKPNDNKFVYFITDVIRGITMIVRPRRFNGVYVRFVNLLIIGLKLIGKLMGASLIYYGVLTFISIFVPSIDGSKWDIIDGLADLDRNVIARTLLSIFCLFFGRLLTKRQN